MKTINREIVGAFIIASDDKILLGYNKKGGVYQGKLVVPGGGIEEGETERQALKREVQEETGIDISSARIEKISVTHGESEKFMKELNETVWVKMTFYNFFIYLPQESAKVRLTFDDDYGPGEWYGTSILARLDIADSTRALLVEKGLISEQTSTERA